MSTWTAEEPDRIGDADDIAFNRPDDAACALIDNVHDAEYAHHADTHLLPVTGATAASATPQLTPDRRTRARAHEHGAPERSTDR